MSVLSYSFDFSFDSPNPRRESTGFVLRTDAPCVCALGTIESVSLPVRTCDALASVHSRWFATIVPKARFLLRVTL